MFLADHFVGYIPEILLLVHSVPALLVALGFAQLAVHVEAAGLEEGGVSQTAVEGGLGSLYRRLPAVGEEGLDDPAEDTLVVPRDLRLDGPGVEAEANHVVASLAS